MTGWLRAILAYTSAEPAQGDSGLANPALMECVYVCVLFTSVLVQTWDVNQKKKKKKKEFPSAFYFRLTLNQIFRSFKVTSREPLRISVLSRERKLGRAVVA